MSNKPKASLTEHSQEVADATIRAAIPVNGVFWDFLTEIRLDSNFGANEYERGKIEGMRELAAVLQAKASTAIEG